MDSRTAAHVLNQIGSLSRADGRTGPATIAVIKDLIENGESSLLSRLSESTPPGLIQMVRVPGLGIAQILKLARAK